jgi:hypothetical protein
MATRVSCGAQLIRMSWLAMASESSGDALAYRSSRTLTRDSSCAVSCSGRPITPL